MHSDTGISYDILSLACGIAIGLIASYLLEKWH